MLQIISDTKTIIFDYGATLDTNGKHWSKVIFQGYQYAKVNIDETTFKKAYVFAERALAKAPIIQKTDDFRILLQKKIRIELEALDFYNLLPFETKEIESFTHVISDYCNNYVEVNMKHTHKVLRTLHNCNKNLILVSNFYGNIQQVLKQYQLNNYFTQVIESAVVGVRKPNPEIFHLGIRSTNTTPEDSIVIGDSYKKDILPAKSIGCKTIWLKGEAWEEEQTDGKAADLIITNIEDIL